MLITHNLGYPRIGDGRQLKKALESYWRSEISADVLLHGAKTIRLANWHFQKNIGLDLLPCHDFSLYDQCLDMTCLLGNVPRRFEWDQKSVNLDLYFRMARGVAQDGQDNASTYACDMSKWFDTNYHYIVPELNPKRSLKLTDTKIFDETQEILSLNMPAKAVLIGPITYLFLAKNEENDISFYKWDMVDVLISLYIEILERLGRQGVSWVQLDEPIFSHQMDENIKNMLRRAYETLMSAISRDKSMRVLVANYFGDLRDNTDLFASLPVDALHVDATRTPINELMALTKRMDPQQRLSIGIVDGRNVWKNDLKNSLKILNQVVKGLHGNERLMIAPSCSLLHSPISLRHETTLNPEIKPWLAFAEEKLHEVVTLKTLLTDGEDAYSQGRSTLLSDNSACLASRKSSSLIHDPQVKERLQSHELHHPGRSLPFSERQKIQQKQYHLPLFPTTTIGSFPQTKDIRKTRRLYKKGRISHEEYVRFMRNEIKGVIAEQEKIGLDVLVHGEAERNDMVEYFGEQLSGFTFTEKGWVQSYGSRCVKPPLLYGDVSRPKTMTVSWAQWAQSLTKKPVKGMLTGPITILQWSFVRDDQDRKTTAEQVALALKDEVLDLEKAGITIIQIDEPALREGLPLRKEDQKTYLKWAVNAFRIAYTDVKNTTQIHTHMCYSEFNDILSAIADLDADVISMETSRSQMELLEAFARFKYPNAIGPGVYDVHSSRVPQTKDITHLLQKAGQVLSAKRLWVNPDCGLKTRRWHEVKPALTHMVAAAKIMREVIQT